MEKDKRLKFWRERDDFLMNLELIFLNANAQVSETTWEDIETKLDCAIGSAITHGAKLKKGS